MKHLLILALIFATIPLAARGPAKVPALADVHSVYVQGNNPAATEARMMISNGKSCFSLVPNQDTADAVLQLDAQQTVDTSILATSMLGPHNVRWTVTGTITAKGDAIWFYTENSTPGMFDSGVKGAAKMLLNHACHAKP